MPKYHVDIQEIWVQTMEIEAESSEEAVDLVLAGNGEVVDDALEYSHTLDSVSDVREIS